MQREPEITINGVTLTEAQAATVRVTIGNFQIELNDADFMRALGGIGLSYRDRLREVTGYILNRRGA